MKKYTLEVLPYDLGILRLSPEANIPPNIQASRFYTISKSDKELSIVAESIILSKLKKGFPVWNAFRFADVLDFNLTGILADISRILADEGISIFAISTYETDYILVRREQISEAKNVLQNRYNIEIVA